MSLNVSLYPLFPQIRLCEVHCRSPLDTLYPGSRRLATARSLHRSAPADAAARLRQEAEPLCRVTDRHVTRLLGLCTLDEAPGLLVEHLEHGDLNEFLRRAHHDGARGDAPLGSVVKGRRSARVSGKGATVRSGQW